jgi:hypothetical protein
MRRIWESMAAFEQARPWGEKLSPKLRIDFGLKALVRVMGLSGDTT